MAVVVVIKYFYRKNKYISIPVNKLWCVLKSKGMPPDYIDAVRELHETMAGVAGDKRDKSHKRV